MHIKIKINGKKYKFKKVNEKFFHKLILGYKLTHWIVPKDESKRFINFMVTSKHSHYNFKKGVKCFYFKKY